MRLTLTDDHGIINGAYATQFLNFIREQLENPQQISDAIVP